VRQILGDEAEEVTWDSIVVPQGYLHTIVQQSSSMYPKRDGISGHPEVSPPMLVSRARVQRGLETLVTRQVSGDYGIVLGREGLCLGSR